MRNTNLGSHKTRIYLNAYYNSARYQVNDYLKTKKKQLKR